MFFLLRFLLLASLLLAGLWLFFPQEANFWTTACGLLVLYFGSGGLVDCMGLAAHAAGDPTGSAVDWLRVSKTAPDLKTVANTVGNLKVGLNMTWTLMTGFLMFFMQAGFALMENGILSREEL
jgi:hypothetical protein